MNAPGDLGRPQGRALSPRGSGFTLVELLVALMLGAMIAVVISIISSSARKAYTDTVQKVEVYNRFRLVFSQVMKDLSAWIPTQELEFYVDGRGGKPRDFHWQPNEELQDRSDDRGPGVVDGGVVGEYDEFAYILQRQYASVELDQVDVGNLEEKVHDAYQIYFRTMTYTDGYVREANVEYMLVDTSRPRSEYINGAPPPPSKVSPENVKDLSLYKIVRFFDIGPETITRMANYPIERRVLEVASNVTDFRVEYVAINPFNSRGVTEFRTPESDYQKPIETATRPIRIRRNQVQPAAPVDVYRKVFGYGSVKLELRYPRATAYAARWGDEQLRSRIGHLPTRFGFWRDPNIVFAELAVGDRIFIFTDNAAGQTAAAANAGGGVSQFLRFPSGDYTVKANLQGQLEFYEDIDTSTWNDQDQRPLNYKAAFLPSALRITLRMVDDEGRNPKTMQQVIWLRRRAR